MPLHLNLLHEQITEQRQRQRDPLKLGIMALSALGALMLLFYMFKAYKTLETKNRLSRVEAEWAKVEPKVTAAQKQAKELTTTINTMKVLDTMIEGRFFWAPFLQKVSRCVAPNAQVTNIDGSVSDDNKIVTSTVQGVAAGREPRAAAEELRQLLSEQLAESYTDVKVEFKALEDLDTLVNVAGANMTVARYSIGITFNPAAPGSATPTPAPKK
ncbi:MAG TPA: hypothetical protein VG095_05270 [Chthoniobacterales bacterium]|nr:hypothetical protein [Chthoniobacterales bacterium]